MLQFAAHLLFHGVGVRCQIFGRVGHRPGLPRRLLGRLRQLRQKAPEHGIRGGFRQTPPQNVPNRIRRTNAVGMANGKFLAIAPPMEKPSRWTR